MELYVRSDIKLDVKMGYMTYVETVTFNLRIFT